MTIRNSARLFHHVLFSMESLHLVLPALNLSTLNAGILIMMHKIRLNSLNQFNLIKYFQVSSKLQNPLFYTKTDDVLIEHGGLLNVLSLTVHLRFYFAGQVVGTTLNLSYSLRFIVGPLLHA